MFAITVRGIEFGGTNVMTHIGLNYHKTIRRSLTFIVLADKAVTFKDDDHIPSHMREPRS